METITSNIMKCNILAAQTYTLDQLYNKLAMLVYDM